MTTHRYAMTATWEGSTGVGYEGYLRQHALEVTGPDDGRLELSGDPGFLGDGRLLNPEQLLVAAASSCQLLAFLAVAARARIDVVAYADAASGEMPDDDLPVRITRIDLRPTITVRGDVSAERIEHLVEVAHRECFVANSLRTEIVVRPTVVLEG